MTHNKIERELNKLYDFMVSSEAYESEKEDQNRIKAAFLNEIDQIFGVPYQMSGSRMNYSYYYQGQKFIEINLLEAPHTSDREKFLAWFAEKLELAFENLRNYV